MKRSTNTKGRIVDAAWRLFYENGFDNTTVEDIVAESGTSKGSFYHYFVSKDSLLGSLAYLFDEKYAELEPQINPSDSCIDTLCFLNKELFSMIEKRVDIDLLSRLFATQLLSERDKALLDRNRLYYRLLGRIISDGLEKGELDPSFSKSELVRSYAVFERGLMYDWCLGGGENSLCDFSQKVLPIYLKGFVKK